VRGGPGHHVDAVFDGDDAADAGADDDAAALGIPLGEVDARVVDGLDGGGDAELAEPVDAFGFAVLDGLDGVEVLDLTGDADVPLVAELGELVARDGADAGSAFAHAFPGGPGVQAEVGDRAHPGDDDAWQVGAGVSHGETCGGSAVRGIGARGERARLRLSR
jgi:hypothetical protein